MNEYAKKAFEAAKAQHLTAADVAELDYSEIAAMAKVTVELNGDSSADFLYRSVRRQVFQLLSAKERDDRLEAIRSAAENVAKLQAGLSDLTITIDADGRLRVASAKVTSDMEKVTFSDTQHASLEAKGINI